VSDGDGFDGDLLRRNPAAFFGLGSAFDAKDLRRAYHAAIRRFRPETHPREFQLLREAHERLAFRIEAGAAARGSEPVPLEEGPSAASRPLGTPGERRAAYGDLSREPRRPEEFVALALLSDAIPSTEKGFEAWILEGLARHPADDGLEALFRVYQQEDLGSADIPRFLRRAAMALPPRTVWRLTAYSWETAALSLPFPAFRDLWEQCESPEDDIDEVPRAALMAYLLPLLTPDADRKWLEETVAWLARLHDVLRNDAAVLDAIDSWIPLREAMEEGKRGPRRRTKEEAARLKNPFHAPRPEPARFPGGPAGDAAKALLGALLASGCRDGADRLAGAARRVRDRTAGILDAFRPPDPELSRILGRMARWTGPLAAHHPSFEPDREPKEEARLVYAVHRKAEAALRGTKEGFLLGMATTTNLRVLDLLATGAAAIALFVGGVTGLAFLIMGMGRGSGQRSLEALFGGVAVGIAVGGAYFLMRHPPNFGARLQERFAASAQRRAYFRGVRPVVLEAIRDLGLPPEALVDPEVIRPVEVNPLVVWGAAQDPALPILRIAYRFAP